ncbi:hypothetical protein HDU91_005495 [Kappamyces sp. JEL0680]|nr:hypothetical protein HDU91_005495 [Kappamyces sp. JEL0680]
MADIPELGKSAFRESALEHLSSAEFHEWALISDRDVKQELLRDRSCCTADMLQFLLENNLLFDLVVLLPHFICHTESSVLERYGQSLLEACIALYDDSAAASLLEIVAFSDPAVLRNALVSACNGKCTAIAKRLLKRTKLSSNDAEPLLLACENRLTEVVKLLLQDVRYPPEILDRVLDSCIHSNSVDLVKLILQLPQYVPDPAFFKLAFDLSLYPIIYLFVDDSRTDLSVDDWYVFKESCKYGDQELVESFVDRMNETQVKALAALGYRIATTAGHVKIQRFLAPLVPREAMASLHSTDNATSGPLGVPLSAENDDGDQLEFSDSDSDVTMGAARDSASAPVERVVCQLCPPGSLAIGLNVFRAHVAGHIVQENFKIQRCGFCGKSDPPCRTQLVPGKFKGSSKFKASVVPQPDPDCTRFFKFNYGAVVKRASAKTCSNIPVECTICKEWLWTYGLKLHFAKKHAKKKMPADLAAMATIGERERQEMINAIPKKNQRLSNGQAGH